MTFRKWLQGNREPIVQKPVIVQDIAPAEVPDKELEAETKEVRLEFVHGLLKLGRRSAELRSVLASSALFEVGGRNAKNPHQ